MNKKRLIITSLFSILLVSILMIGSTYSIFTSSDIDENANVYTTGNLNINYTLSEDSIQITDINPMSERQAEVMITPYQITVSNDGTVPYQFDLILNDTTAGDVVDYQYIMVQIGKLASKPLSECIDNIIQEDIIVPANDSVTIDVRIWLAENIQSTEIGKSFYAKLSVDGLAIYDNSTDIDNTILVAEPILFLSDVTPGSYVTYLGRNGCDFSSGSCGGKNANYISNTDMGYCSSDTSKFNTTGWRLAYVKDSIPYLISAGSPECICTNADGTPSEECNLSADTNITSDINSEHLANLMKASLKYCNVNYAYHDTCDETTAWNLNELDFNSIMTNEIALASCIENASTECGKDNVLINNGGNYWSIPATTTTETSSIFSWKSTEQYWRQDDIDSARGIRPILKLDEKVIIVGGEGTSHNPYRLATYKTRIKDLSGNTNHGVNQGATLDNETGTIMTDGASTYIDAGLLNYDFKNQITLIAKVKFNTLASSQTDQYIFGNWDNGGAGFLIKNNRLTFNIYIDGTYREFYSTITPVVNTWYTLVGTYDGTNIKFYTNGIEATLDTDITNSTNSVTGTIGISSKAFFIGGKPETGNTLAQSSSTSGSDAIFDDILIFNRTLTTEEITSDYQEKITVNNQNNLLLYYNFQE